jgi:hypothetical protein
MSTRPSAAVREMGSDLAEPSLTVIRDEEQLVSLPGGTWQRKDTDTHPGPANCYSAVPNLEWNDRGCTMAVSGRSVSANTPLTSSTCRRPSMVSPNHLVINHACHRDVECSMGHQCSPSCWLDTAGCFPHRSTALYGNSDPPSSDRLAEADAVNCDDARMVAVI